jgi:hypothetical protein
MAKTMIAVYNTLSDARTTLQSLAEAGFDASSLKLVTNDQNHEHLVDVRGLIGGLIGISAAPRSFVELNIPKKETDVYLEGLGQGQSLVVATIADNQSETVKEIMSRHHASEITRV